MTCGAMAACKCYLRALLGGGSMILSDADESPTDFLTRLGKGGVTHISGTPSHWRRALMSPAATAMTPSYVRLSGEIADQAILDSLHRTYPEANLAHAYATTEAGVGFDVRDGKAGFPASLIGNPDLKAELKVEGGTLHIRSARTASGYIGKSLSGADGFVDTGDLGGEARRSLLLRRTQGRRHQRRWSKGLSRRSRGRNHAASCRPDGTRLGPQESDHRLAGRGRHLAVGIRPVTLADIRNDVIELCRSHLARLESASQAATS